MRKLGWAVIAAAGMAIGAAAPASAAENIMQQCGAKYQAAKAGKTLPAGQTWQQFLSQCRSGHAVAAAPAKPAAKAPAAVKAQGAPSAAQVAMRARMKTCSAQWQAEKAAKKLPAGQTWPKYWSQCSAKLKG